jgi:hypothetical protein
METELDLGWCQGYMALQYHMTRALIENNECPRRSSCCPDIAIFSKKYYNEINELNHTKIYDYCFIGSINSSPENRKWVVEFAKKKFTSNSIFVNTDVNSGKNPNWQLLGPFDYSKCNWGYSPKEQPDSQSEKVQYRVVKENVEYFETMCQSKYVLCPKGDASWSFRFYEVLMCNTIPIVESWHDTYRTKEESKIKYKYVLLDDVETEIAYDDYVKINARLFEKYHLL